MEQEYAIATVEKAKHRFSIKVCAAEELRVRIAYGKKKLEEKKKREKEERMRKMREQTKTAAAAARSLSLADSNEFAPGAFLHLCKPAAASRLHSSV